jgi:ubiquinol-cytochrome c reductase cytochrome b subunit
VNKVREAAIWLDRRLYISKVWAATAGHEIPKSSASWFYALGSAVLLCFVIQVITGALLAFTYSPTAEGAYDSLQYLNNQQFLGGFLRAIHNWCSLFMVVLVVMHMTQVYLFGAYKYPRELTWVSGVFLLLFTLGMAFTGQVLRFDQDAYWGVGIGAAITGRVPVLGPYMVHLLLAGPIIASPTLGRFFSLHVFIIPGLIIALVSMHLRLVLTKGINEYPVAGRPVRKATYDAEYAEIIKKDGIPFAPDGIWKDLVMSSIVIVGILACAYFFGPKGPGLPPNPAVLAGEPRPDSPFLWMFSALALLPVWAQVLAVFVAPVILIGALLALPFVSNEGEKIWSRRPLAVMTVVFAVVVIGGLSWVATYSPWAPHMEAWSSDPIPPAFLKGRTPLEIKGALVLQGKQCRDCHSVGGMGGLRGPALDDVATRLTKDQMVRQVIQGGGNMPSYGKELTPAEVEAVVAFLSTMRPHYIPPAQPSDEPSKPNSREHQVQRASVEGSSQ